MNLNPLAQDLISGHANEVALLTKLALDEGVPLAVILENGLIAGMKVVGDVLGCGLAETARTGN